jgi:hypothetical protein
LAEENVLAKRYNNFLGVDYKSNDLVRPIEFASDALNAQYTKVGTITKREGFQYRAASSGISGLFSYNRIDPDTGKAAPELISLDDEIRKLIESTITITYTGSEAFVPLNLFYDEESAEFRCTIDDGTTNVLDFDIGIGVDESSPVTVEDLRAAIDALANFSASITGSTTVPAAFLKLTRNLDLSGGTGALTAYSWQDVDTVAGAGLAGSVTNKNDSEWQQATSAQINNVLYLSNGYDEVHKYDGQNFYRAGLPTPIISSALGGGGAITGTNYYHTVTYVQKDAAGNFIEGNYARVTSGLNPTAQSMDVTVDNIQDGSGFNTNGAIVDGIQAGVNTIAVDNGSGGSQTLVVGDTAYFYDGVTGDYVERKVTSASANSITIDGAAVDVSDNAVISNNLRIAIYRNKTIATVPNLFFLIEEIPNNPFTATQVFNDNILDTNLGAEFIEAAVDRSPPPKGRYLSSWRNLLMISGNIDNQKTLYWSDVDGPEYFPADRNSLETEGVPGDRIKGISPNNEVFVAFLDSSFSVISGDLVQGNIRVDHVSHNVGLASHHTIKEVRGALYYLSKEGPRFLVGGQLPKPMGVAVGDRLENSSRIDPVFDQGNVTDEQRFAIERAISVVDDLGERYMLCVPCESFSGSDRFSNGNTRVFTYDFTKDSWLPWDNIDYSGGVAQYQGSVWFKERRLSSSLGTVVSYLARFSDIDDAWDYQDHHNSIALEYKSQWEHLGDPSVFKKFLDLKIFSIEQITNNENCVEWDAESNFIQDFVKASGQIDFTILGYGQSAYGSAPFGDPSEPDRKQRIVEKAKAMRIVWKNSEPQQTPVITAWELQVAPNYKRFFK